MFVQKFFVKRQVRRFKITPFYYEVPEETEADPDKPRIQFRQVRRGVKLEKKPIKLKIVLVILLLVFMYYFWGLVDQEIRRFQIEDLRIEMAPSDY